MPLEVAASFGLDPEQILKDFPELRDILIYGLPPLTFNRNLYAAASAHSQDMLENGYYSHFSLDGRTFEDRIRESGYDPLTTGESLGLFRLCGNATPEKGVDFLFERIFTDELKPDSAADRNILDDRGLKEVGISFIAGTSIQLGGICGDQVSLLVADFGSSAAMLDPALVGVVYSDLDQDGLYSQGEGIPGVAISINGPSGLLNIYTNYVELEEENQTVMFNVSDSEEGDHLE
jgi:hypothetical protein